MARQSNYDLQFLRAKNGFLQYDSEQIAQTFGLERDGAYLYVPFLGQTHRICRKTALPEYEAQGVWHPSGFHEGMTIFDMLTRSRTRPVLSGCWCAHGNLNAVHSGTMKNELSVNSLSPELSELFSGNIEKLRAVCEHLGASPAQKGDFACILPLFPWFSVLLRFWDADEEFPAQLQLLWDRDTTRCLSYETTFYTSTAVADRLAELARQIDAPQGIRSI